MQLSAFNYGANAVCYIKNEKRYGMICAWAMQVDFDKVMLTLGAQSVTGKNICKGDIIGVSALNEHQENVVDALGNNHSDELDKFINVQYSQSGSAILINNATNRMVVEVIDVLHLDRIEEDYLVYGLVKSYESTDVDMYTLPRE